MTINPTHQPILALILTPPILAAAPLAAMVRAVTQMTAGNKPVQAVDEN